jgi:hypothetical protein
MDLSKEQGRMKRSISLLAVLALVAVVYLSGRKAPMTAQAAEGRRLAFLIRLGVDGVADVDWSGRIDPAPARMTGWQFDRGDTIDGGNFKCKTREQNYWDTPYEKKMRPTSNRDKVTVKGVVAEFDAAQGGDIRVSTGQGEFSFPADASLWLTPRRFLNGRVEVRAAPVTTILAPGAKTSDDSPSLLETRDGALWMAYASHVDGGGDQVLVRRRAAGAEWSKPEALTGAADGDLFHTAIAEDKAGKIWVVWSAQVSSNFDLYGRAFDGKRWRPVERLTSAPGADIFHTMTLDRAGNLYLAYQSSRAGNFDIYLRTYDGKRWSEEMQVSSDAANDWEPALAAAPDGRVTILWDTYAKGNYDVVARTFERGRLGPLTAITSSGAFEARASAQYDRLGRLWIVWDEGDFNWGKDYGFAIPESGRGLLTRRQARIAVLANGKLMQPGAWIGDAIPADFQQVFHEPRLALDRNGAPWVTVRYRVNLPKQTGKSDPANRALWRLGATTYRDGKWTPLLEFPECSGRIDAESSAVAGRDGSLQIAWVGDGRQWPLGAPAQHGVCVSTLPAAAPSAPVDLVAYQAPTDAAPPSDPAESADVARVRAYRAKTGTGELRIARGDMHRHTDISWDGNRDGSLFDSYRYAMDAVSFDYLGVCDHQAGQSIPYNWWRIQKAVDMFTIPDKFTPLYSYERSLPYPNGHRNVLFATRGKPILEIARAEITGEEGAAKLYAYLRRLGGITMAHTTATGAGTDWRDNDPEVEPAVEIYQGYRASYEGLGSPRQDRNESKNHQAGYVQNAWAKGYRLGVQSSSDHVSTHISYAALYVDKLNREALLQALKERRTYAATDNLIIDFQMGDHFMGETFTAHSTAPLKAYIRGTGPLESVALIKNNRVVYTKPGEGAEMNFTYTDAAAAPGKSYYYLRVEQKNGQIGWSSPIWVKIE